MLFSGLHSKLQYWNNQQQLLQLKGLSPNQWCLLAGSYFHEQLFSDTHVLICSDQDEAENVYEALKHLKNVFFYRFIMLKHNKMLKYNFQSYFTDLYT